MTNLKEGWLIGDWPCVIRMPVIKLTGFDSWKMGTVEPSLGPLKGKKHKFYFYIFFVKTWFILHENLKKR